MPPPPEENTPAPQDPKDIKKVTEETKKQAKANSDAADAAKSAADAAKSLADATREAVDAGKEEVKLTKEQIEQKKKLADIAAKAKADKKEAVEAGKAQAEIAKSFGKISFMGIFKARIAMKGFMKTLKTMDGTKLEMKTEGLSDLGDAFSKLSSMSYFGAKRAERGMMILGGALVNMQKMSDGPLEVMTGGFGDMSKMVESMGNVGYFTGRRMKKFLKTFIGYLSPFMHDIAKLETGPALDPVFNLIDAFSKFADKGRKANKSVKILAKSLGTLMGMKIKKGKAEKGGVGAEEAIREKERLEDERHSELINTLQGMMSGGKGGGKKAKGGIFGLISGLLGGAGGGIASMAKGVVNAFGAVVTTIMDIVGKFVDLIRTVVTTIIDIVTKIATSIAEIITKIGSAIATVIEKVLTALGNGLAKMGTGPALAGALALLIVAAGVFVLAKAFVEFTKVDFKSLFVGIIAIGALTAAMIAIGILMMSGIGAVAILAGAAAFLIMAFAAMALGKAFTYLGEGIAMIMVGIGIFVDKAVAGFVALAQPGIALGLLGAAAGIIAVTAAITAFIAVLTLAGAASTAGGIVSGVLGSIGSFFGGPGPPPGPFEMLDKFIGFAAAAPFLTEGAKAINEIGAALSTFLGMNFAAVGAELGQLAMILLSFDAVHLGIGGGILGMLTFGIIKAKSPLDILKELASLAPDINKLGNGIFKLAQGLQMLSGIPTGTIEGPILATAAVGRSGQFTAVDDDFLEGGAEKQIADATNATVNSPDKIRLAKERLESLKAENAEGEFNDRIHNLEFMIDKLIELRENKNKGYLPGIDTDRHIERMERRLERDELSRSVTPSSGGYAPGEALDKNHQKLKENTSAKETNQAATVITTVAPNVSVDNSTMVGAPATARSPNMDDEDWATVG